MKRFTWVGVTVLLVACGYRGGSEASPMPDRGPDCVRGQLRVTGPDGFERVLVRSATDSTDVTILGSLRSLAGKLSGGEVEACGERGIEEGREILSTSRLTLLAMDGMEAHLGVLRPNQGGWALVEESEEAEVIPLASVPDDLVDSVGTLVWVSGRWEGPSFTVLSFGVVGEI